MSKNATFFVTSIAPLGIFSTYRYHSLTPEGEVFRSPDTGARLILAPGDYGIGHIFFQRSEDVNFRHGTHITTITGTSFTELDEFMYTFEYFGQDVFIERIDQILQIGIVYQSDLVSKFNTGSL